MKLDFREKINNELSELIISEELKNKIYHGSYSNTNAKYKYREHKIAVIIFIIFGFITTTAFIGHKIYNYYLINQQVLPPLNDMKVVNMIPLDEATDEDGFIEKDYRDYKEIKNKLGIQLLDSKLSEGNSYMVCHISTDNRDYAVITVDNYILGDTSKYEYNDIENRYFYEKGQQYNSPISLEVSMILSEEQLEHGWDTEYLGYYQFLENYVSPKGYKVNILEDTIEKDSTDYISEKTAIFVVEGIEYIIKGRTSLDNIKIIVDSME